MFELVDLIIAFVLGALAATTLLAWLIQRWANKIKVLGPIYYPVSSFNMAPGTTLSATINTPTYLFTTVTGTGIAYIQLPTINSNNIGIKFYVKNMSSANNTNSNLKIINLKNVVKYSKLKRNLLFRARNGLKYLLFLLGLYKAKTSYRELEDQIDLVLKLAKKKANQVIWIQQKPLQTPRIAVERSIHKKYFKRINAKMDKVDREFVKFINLEDIAKNHDFYIYDGVHLSEKGHRHLADLVTKEIEAML